MTLCHLKHVLQYSCISDCMVIMSFWGNRILILCFRMHKCTLKQKAECKIATEATQQTSNHRKVFLSDYLHTRQTTRYTGDLRACSLADTKAPYDACIIGC